jgi:hypothetical protein
MRWSAANPQRRSRAPLPHRVAIASARIADWAKASAEDARRELRQRLHLDRWQTWGISADVRTAKDLALDRDAAEMPVQAQCSSGRSSCRNWATCPPMRIRLTTEKDNLL